MKTRASKAKRFRATTAATLAVVLLSHCGKKETSSPAPASPAEPVTTQTSTPEPAEGGVHLPSRKERTWVLFEEIDNPIQVLDHPAPRQSGSPTRAANGLTFRGKDDGFVLDELELSDGNLFLRLEMYPFDGYSMILDAGNPDTGGFGLYLEEWILKFVWRIPGKDPEEFVLGELEKGQRTDLQLRVNRTSQVLAVLRSSGIKDPPPPQKVSGTFPLIDGKSTVGKLTIANAGGDPLIDGKERFPFQGVILALHVGMPQNWAAAEAQDTELFGNVVLPEPPTPEEQIELKSIELVRYSFNQGQAEPTHVAGGLSATPIQSGAGITMEAGFTEERYGGKDHPLLRVAGGEHDNMEDAIGAEDYFEFTVTPENKMSFHKLAILAASGGTGDRGFAVFSDIKEFEANKSLMRASGKTLHIRKFPDEPFSADLSGTRYQNRRGPVTFRIYIRAGENGRSLEFDDIVLYGLIP